MVGAASARTLDTSVRAPNGAKGLTPKSTAPSFSHAVCAAGGDGRLSGLDSTCGCDGAPAPARSASPQAPEPGLPPPGPSAVAGFGIGSQATAGEWTTSMLLSWHAAIVDVSRARSPPPAPSRGASRPPGGSWCPAASSSAFESGSRADTNSPGSPGSRTDSSAASASKESSGRGSACSTGSPPATGPAASATPASSSAALASRTAGTSGSGCPTGAPPASAASTAGSRSAIGSSKASASPRSSSEHAFPRRAAASKSWTCFPSSEAVTRALGTSSAPPASATTARIRHHAAIDARGSEGCSSNSLSMNSCMALRSPCPSRYSLAEVTAACTCRDSNLGRQAGHAQAAPASAAPAGACAGLRGSRRPSRTDALVPFISTVRSVGWPASGASRARLALPRGSSRSSLKGFRPAGPAAKRQVSPRAPSSATGSWRRDFQARMERIAPSGAPLTASTSTSSSPAWPPPHSSSCSSRPPLPARGPAPAPASKSTSSWNWSARNR
mmetsp:Transcript_88221/g.263030  ORF Transcript_88221/g.263030 Transcript_88221/m.263030 type:complete len:500 (-) Transcript_88221:481-1980(-)